MLVVGAGAVGVEFASIYRSFDAEVTVLEALPRMVPLEDEDISKELMRAFTKKGIACHVSTKVEKVEKTKSGIAVTFTPAGGKQQKLEAEKILIAVGRAPRTDNIGLEKTKIKPERGFIKTNEWMQTAEPNVYTIGDIVLGMPQLAHVGAMQGIVAVAKIAGKAAKPVNPLHIPNCTYCEPQIGSVGLTEAKAKEAGRKVQIGKVPFAANSKASIVGAHEGFIKVVSDAEYGEILGAHIVASHASEMIHELAVARANEYTVEEGELAVHAHPTLSEAVAEAALGSKVEVPTIDGPTTIRIPPGTQGGQKLRLRGKGTPSLRASLRGDEFVEVQVVVPRVADERSKEILKELGRLNPADPRSELKKYHKPG